MKILHLVSNFRWTERVEPAADLAIAQQRLGHDVRFIFHKHFRWVDSARDLARLKTYIATFRPDVIHCHLPHDHLLAALAVRSSSPRPLLVRTFYEPDGPQWPLRYRLLCRPVTDGLVVVHDPFRLSERGPSAIPPERIATLIPGIDVDEFAHRADLGRLPHIDVPPGATVIGMVASINQRRRLDLALEAAAELAPRHPSLRLLFVGRGKPDLFIHAPARRLGISDRILVAGYCRNDDLIRAYHTMDALLYPFHGTDHSCRTVREALAAGLPVVASHLGILPSLVQEGVTGFLGGFSPHGLAQALEKFLLLDPAARARMAAAAAHDARARFCRLAQARQVLDFYDHLLRLPKPAP